MYDESIGFNPHRHKSMADDDVQNGEQPGPRSGRMVLLMSLIGAVGLGLTGGALVLGPAVADRLSATASERANGDGETPDTVSPGSQGPVEARSYTVDRLVLNPAGTMGTRFLTASIVVSLDRQSGVEVLRARDPEVRDRLMALLSSRTIEELSDVRQRESLREEIVSTLAELAAPARVEAVFLPTFLIQ